VLFCLIIFISVRIIGLAVSIDYFHSRKDKLFIFLAIGWILWIFAAFFPIFAENIEINSLKELFLFLNALFGLIGGIFYTWGFYKYFKNIQFKILEIFLVFSLIIPFSLYYFANFRIAIQFSATLLNLLIFATYLIPRILINDLKTFLGKSNIWYHIIFVSLIIFIPISIISSLLGNNYGLYQADNTFIIIIYYTPTIISSILFIIQLVHLEYTISFRQKNDLKDIYSHNLGNIIQVIIGASDLIKLSANLKDQEKRNLDLVQTKCKESAKLIKEIREL
jgi:hypothetical protein